MAKQALKYDAFISYRHTELDKYVAESLHKELENFRIPQNILKKLREKEGQRTRINRVFRDRDELPIASNLADPIVQALQASDFLIVICTPRLLESIWCKTEIETFIKIHGREKVLAVLAEGEPCDSFPREILFDENQKPVEPLAADVRGKSKREIRKKIKEEVIRLAAAMFECAYDELKQRHRERRLKRIIIGALAGAAICFAFGSISTTMALRIHKQSLEIEKQAVKIEEQYTEAMKTNAKSMAADALRLLESGDRIGAINMAVSALPGKDKNSEMPYTPQAQYALTESLYVYENGHQILPIHILEQEAEISFIRISPNKDRILVVDIYGNICLWDAWTREKLVELKGNKANFGLSEGQAGFLSNDLIIFAKDKGFVIYDAADKKEVFKNEDFSVGEIVVSGDGNTFAILGYDGIKVFQGKEYTEIFYYEPGDMEEILYKASLDEKGTKFAFVLEDTGESKVTRVFLSELSDGKITEVNKIEDMILRQLKLTDKELFSVVYKENKDAEGSFQDYKSIIYANSTEQDAEPLWMYPYDKGIVNEIKTMVTPEGEFTVFSGYGYLGILDRKTGEIFDECNYGEGIVDFELYEGTSIIGLMMRSGEYHFLNIESRVDLVQAGKFISTSDNIKEFLWGEKFFASVEYGDTSVTIYSMIAGEKVEPIYKGMDYTTGIVLNEKQTELIFLQNENLSIYDVEREQVKYDIQTEDFILGAKYLEGEENTLIVALPEKLLFVDTQTGKTIKEITLEDYLYNFKDFFAGGALLAAYNLGQIQVFDTQTGKIKEVLEAEEEFDVLDAYAIGAVSDKYAIAAKSSQYLKIYQRGTKESIAKIPLNAACVSYINFADKDEKIYVTYIDGKVEVYDVKTLALLRTYTEFAKEVEEVQTDEESNLTYLFTVDEGYALNESGDVIARIDSLKAVLSSRKQYIISNINTLYTVPKYELEDLMKAEVK